VVLCCSQIPLGSANIFQTRCLFRDCFRFSLDDVNLSNPHQQALNTFRSTSAIPRPQHIELLSNNMDRMTASRSAVHVLVRVRIFDRRDAQRRDGIRRVPCYFRHSRDRKFKDTSCRMHGDLSVGRYRRVLPSQFGASPLHCKKGTHQTLTRPPSRLAARIASLVGVVTSTSGAPGTKGLARRYLTHRRSETGRFVNLLPFQNQMIVLETRASRTDKSLR
jgi:hypothetical protein